MKKDRKNEWKMNGIEKAERDHLRSFPLFDLCIFHDAKDYESELRNMKAE